MNNLLLNNGSHPIITEKNSYSLDKKLLTVHANDREKFYYNTPSSFSIKTPQAYTNVQSIKLSEISIPNKINNFSKKLNNNKFNFSDVSLSIPDGNYSYDELAAILQTLISDNKPPGVISTDLNVKYLPKLKRFIFYYNLTNVDKNSYFTISIDQNSCFTQNKNNKIDVFNTKPDADSNFKNTIIFNEGLLYDLGFDINDILNNSLISDYRNIYRFISDPSFFDINVSTHFIITTSPPRFRDKQPIYMEIDSLNINYDELNPFPRGTNNMFSNLSNSSTKTAFLKIPEYVYNNGGKEYDNNNSIVAFFEAPIKRIQNLKFKFRYHDNMLVDFDNQDINFTLEINQLKNNITNNLNIIKPVL